jgi:hypothetical protein
MGLRERRLELIEIALRAFRQLDATVIFPDVHEACNHKVDLLVLLEMGLSQAEAKALLGDSKGANPEETYLRDLANVKAITLLNVGANLLSRTLILWITIFRLIELHSFSCDDERQSKESIVDIGGSSPFLWTIKIEEMGFSTRVSNALRKVGIENLGQLIEWSDEGLSDISYLGAQGLREIKWKIKEYGVIEDRRVGKIFDVLGLDTPIEELGMTTRTYNALKRKGIDSVQQLQKLNDYDLRDIRNFGQKSINEVHEILSAISTSSTFDSSVEDKFDNLVDWMKDQLILEVSDIESLMSRMVDLFVSRQHQFLVRKRSSHLSIYAECEYLGDVLQGLKDSILKVSSGQQLGALAYNLHFFRTDINFYREMFDSLHPSKEIRDSLLFYENRYSDDSVDLLKFDDFTYFYLGVTDDKSVLLDKETFFELIETIKVQFVTDNLTWESIQKVVEFHKTWGTFPNLIGFLIAHKLAGPAKKQELYRQLSQYFNLVGGTNGARDLDMLFLRSEGETLDKIGSKYNLTRERVRQILLKLAPGLDLVVRYLLDDETDKSAKEIESRLVEIFEDFGAIYKKELAHELGMPEEDAIRKVPKRLQKYIIDRNPEPVTFTAWTKEQVIQEIQKASTYYFPLRTSDYEYLLQIGEIRGPSVPYIYNKFGTWREVCAEAGVEAAQAMRSEYVKLWSEEELLGYVRRFFLEPDLSSSIGSYDSWREQQPDHVPSGVLIRNVFGNWTTVKRKALEGMRLDKGRSVL